MGTVLSLGTIISRVSGYGAELSESSDCSHFWLDTNMSSWILHAGQRRRSRRGGTTYVLLISRSRLRKCQVLKSFTAPFVLTDNPEYKAPSFQELSQPHMKSWMHYNQFILRQVNSRILHALFIRVFSLSPKVT